MSSNDNMYEQWSAEIRHEVQVFIHSFSGCGREKSLLQKRAMSPEQNVHQPQIATVHTNGTWWIDCQDQGYQWKNAFSSKWYRSFYLVTDFPYGAFTEMDVFPLKVAEHITVAIYRL